MPVTPTGGFQLQALPQPLSVPTNIGRIDVPELQQAFRGGMQNVQAARLVGPQTRTALAVADYQTQAAMEGLKRLPEETKALLATYGAQAQQQENLLAAEQARQPFIAPTQTALSEAARIRAETVARTPGGFGRLEIGAGFPPLAYTLGPSGEVQPLAANLSTMAATRGAAGERKEKLRTFEMGGQIFDEIQVTVFNPLGGVVQTYKMMVPTGSVDLGEVRYAQPPLGAPPAVQAPTPAAGTPQVSALSTMGTPAAPTTPLAAQAPTGTAAITTPAPVAQQTAAKDAIPSLTEANAFVTPKDGPIYTFTRRIREEIPTIVAQPDQKQQDQRDKMSQEGVALLEVLKTQKTALQNFEKLFNEARQRGLGPGWQQKVLPSIIQQAFGFPEAENLEAASLQLANEFSNTFTKFRAFGAATQLLLPSKPGAEDDERTIINKLNYYNYLNDRAQKEGSALVGASQYQIPASKIRSIYNESFNPGTVNDFPTWERKYGLLDPKETEKIIEKREQWLKDPKNRSDPTYEQKRKQFESQTGILISIAR